MANDNLSQAVRLLTSKCHVIPEKYTVYSGGFMFLAYPPNMKNKDACLSPYYLVDLKTNSAGPFSPAFDFEGFFKAVETMKNIHIGGR